MCFSCCGSKGAYTRHIKTNGINDSEALVKWVAKMDEIANELPTVFAPKVELTIFPPKP